ncbi:hypothetical protein IAU59_005066 [Kwoniella sp. CBS 9459]
MSDPSYNLIPAASAPPSTPYIPASPSSSPSHQYQHSHSRPHSPSTSASMSTPRQPIKLRLMLATQPKLWITKGGQKRSREDDVDHTSRGSTFAAQPTQEEVCQERKTVGIKAKKQKSHTSHHERHHVEDDDASICAVRTSSAGRTLNFGFGHDPDQQNPVASSSKTSMDIDTRPSTPTSDLPAAKRPRSHSTSSSIVGLLVSDDESPPSPIDLTVSPTLSIASLSPGPATTNNVKSTHPPHVPSPLASSHITGVPLDIPPSFALTVASSGAISSGVSGMSASTRDTEMLTPGPSPLIEGNPMTQLAKARAKFLAEVEALGTEMNNVFKLGYGRALGRGVSGNRGPSRLSVDAAKKVSKDDSGEAKSKDMDVDE